MHYGNVEIVETTKQEITFDIDGQKIVVRRNALR
jgi:hypothetical protein